MRTNIFASVLLFTLLIPSLFSQNLLDLTNPPNRVNDYAQMLNEDEKKELEIKLYDYEQENSTQFVIVTIQSLEGKDIGDYATQLGNKWGVGQKEKDNGLVLLISKSDRKAFLATGKGVEIYISDAAATNLIIHYLVPEFKKGNYYQGIDELTSAVMGTINGAFSGHQTQPLPDSYYNSHASIENANLLMLIGHGVIFGIGLLFWFAQFILKSTDKEDREDFTVTRLGKDKRFLAYILTLVPMIIIMLTNYGDYAPIGIFLSLFSAYPLSYVLAYFYLAIKDLLFISSFKADQDLSIEDFTPAETAMLLSPKKSKGKEMLQYTLMDLVFKNIIEIEPYYVERRNGDHIKKLTVYKGKNFESFEPAKHEEIFVKDVDLSDDEKAIELRYYLQDVFKSIKGFKQYKKDFVGRELAKRGLFTKAGWSLNSFTLADNGNKLQSEIQSILDEIKNNIFSYLQNDKKKGELLLQRAKGNIFLIKGFNGHDYEEIYNLIKKESSEFQIDNFSSNTIKNDLFETEEIFAMSSFNLLAFGLDQDWSISDFDSGITAAYTDSFIGSSAASSGMSGGSYGGGGGFSGGFSGGGGSFGGGGGGASW